MTNKIVMSALLPNNCVLFHVHHSIVPLKLHLFCQMLKTIGFESPDPEEGNFLGVGHPRPPTLGSNVIRRGLLLRGAAAAAAGAILGIVVSMIVNVSLVEVSLSPFFAMVGHVLMYGKRSMIRCQTFHIYQFITTIDAVFRDHFFYCWSTHHLPSNICPIY